MLCSRSDLPTSQLVGDNCDVHGKASHQTMLMRDQDHHWFNMFAAKDRVQGLHLPDDQPIASVANLPLATFLPNVDDCVALRHEFIVLVFRVLIRHSVA